MCRMLQPQRGGGVGGSKTCWIILKALIEQSEMQKTLNSIKNIFLAKVMIFENFGCN